MQVPGYRLDRIVPRELPDAEQVALARMLQGMSREWVPEDPERPLDVIVSRLRARVPNQWNAWVRARDEQGTVVGFGGVSRSLNEPENAHLAWTEISVAAAHRRRRLGRAILAELVGQAEGQHPELVFTGGTSDRIAGGEAFLRAVRAIPGLPMKTSQLNLAEVDRARIAGWAALDPDGYRLERIDDSVPAKLVGPYIAAADGMNDAPRGDLNMGDWKLTEEQIRDRESWFAQTGVRWWLALAIHTATGTGAGFTEITYDPKQPWVIWQQGTAVTRAHRGHRLGLWLKAVMLERILRELPEAKFIRTGNANTNSQMLGINTQLGFRLAWQSTLWQLPIADARRATAATEGATA